jgi:4-hydroxymandelate oxidase
MSIFKVPTTIDSGFRRGSDIFKALALGADAVGIRVRTRWGLAAFVQEGVERVLDILHKAGCRARWGTDRSR